MSRIQEMLKKLRVSSGDAGSAQWSSSDLLGDSHQAQLDWSPTSLSVTKQVVSNGSVQPDFVVRWEVSEKGRLLLKSSDGVPSDVAGSLAVFNFVRQQLEGGNPPVVVAPFISPSKGFSP